MFPNEVLDICLYACLKTKACRGLVVGCPQREREYWSRRGELAAKQLLAGAVGQSRGWEGRRGKKGWWGPSTTCFSSLQVNINKNRFWKRERNFCRQIGAFWDQKFPQQSFKTSTKQLHTCLKQRWPGVVVAVSATGLLSSSSLVPQDLLHYFHVSFSLPSFHYLSIFSIQPQISEELRVWPGAVERQRREVVSRVFERNIS